MVACLPGQVTGGPAAPVPQMLTFNNSSSQNQAQNLLLHHHHQQLPKQQQQQVSLLPPTGSVSPPQQRVPMPQRQHHASTSSTSSLSDVNELNLTANTSSTAAKSMSSGASTSSSTTTTTTTTGRRHGKRQKGQPYIPSYMDLSSGPEPCVVCGDSATGYHYRAMTCEGCKGFFRRTIQKGLKYDCKFGGGCSVDKRTRNQCQQCRYVRCLSVGMAADLVLNEGERLAKRRLIEQNRERRKHQTGASSDDGSSNHHKTADETSNSKPSRPVPTTTAKERVPPISTLMTKKNDDDVPKSSNHQSETAGNSSANFLTVDEQHMIEAVVASYSSALLKLSDHLLKAGNQQQNSTKKSWRQLTELLSPAIVKVVEFAKALPGFTELDNADQVLLLRSGCIEVLCLRVASRPSFKSRLMAVRHHEKQQQQQQQQSEVKPASDFDSLVDPIVEFANGIAKLQLDTTETALLAAVLLMQSDRSGLLHPDQVEACQDRILAAYRKYVCSRRPQHPFHWAKILMKVTDVRAISLKYSEKILSVSVDDSPAPALPSLIMEMLYNAVDDDDNNEQHQPTTTMTMANANNCDDSNATMTSDGTDDDETMDYESSAATNHQTLSSYASSTRSPFTVSSDMPSSPLSVASSSSGSGRAASSPHNAAPPLLHPQAAASTTTVTTTNLPIWGPISPTDSLMSSSSGSGRSASPPSSQQNNDHPPKPTMMVVVPEPVKPTAAAAFALHQLATIALDPLFYQQQLFANPFSHQQLLAAAAHAFATQQPPSPQQQQPTTLPVQPQQTTNTSSSSSTTTKQSSSNSSKYSISSLIA